MEIETNEFFLLFLTISLITVIVLLLIIYQCYVSDNRRNYKLIGAELVSSHDLPYEFLNDEESLVQLSEEYDYHKLSPEEQQSYQLGERFYHENPPNFNHTRGKSLNHSDDLVIRERGINAFEFNQDVDYFQPKYIIEDKTELNFHNNDLPYSTATTILNYCLPVKNRTFSDTIYFETKIFEFPPSANGHFSIGLVTKPYPTFRLPGYNNFSIAYESTGNLKVNKPLPTPLQQHLGEQSLYNALVLPPLLQSDVVGFGYHIHTGTIFITRNGKKIMDVMRGLFIDIYPAIGCFLTNGKFHVNIGQMGFVWIEANVKKYGFISSSDYKRLEGDRGLAALPQYGTTNDKILDKGEALPPRYPEEEIDFFGRSAKEIYNNFGSPSKLDEKEGASLASEDVKKSSSMITNESEEIMDLRERIYEQNTTASLDEVLDNEVVACENSPLMSNNVHYGSNKESTVNIGSNVSSEPERSQSVSSQIDPHHVLESEVTSKVHESSESSPSPNPEESREPIIGTSSNIPKKSKNKKKKRSKNKRKK